MEQTEDVTSLAPVPVFVDDTGRRRRLTRRIGRVLFIGFSAYIGLVMMGFARDPRLGPLHLPTIGLSDLGLMIPPAPLVLGEQTTRSPAADEIAVSTAGHPDGDLAAPTSGTRFVPSSGSGGAAPGPSTKPSGVAPVPGPTPGRAPGPGTSTTSTSSTTTTTTATRKDSPTTTVTTAPSTPTTTSPTTPGQGSASAKGPDGSGPPGRTTEPPGQQRKTTPTTAG